ncbi:hypothetical protein HaLaN_13137 [Haematococcus lacustris]|uniref:Uncharacterized protein n=1 Tax=Haematococcus lacustris TaxID=44745 RepID=A0A699Z3N5_HAELA|nr:hypothetical protein HaLaN_13137 [Haematococcus lacustris]
MHGHRRPHQNNLPHDTARQLGGPRRAVRVGTSTAWVVASGDASLPLPCGDNRVQQSFARDLLRAWRGLRGDAVRDMGCGQALFLCGAAKLSPLGGAASTQQASLRVSARQVTCGSQPSRFRQEFRPAGNDSPAPGPLIIPLSEAVAHDDDEVPDPQYWTQSPHGAFRVPNPHAQYTRLAPIDTMPIGPAGNEAYYYFEMQSFYSKRWPGMRRSAEGEADYPWHQVESKGDTTALACSLQFMSKP